MKKKPHDFYCSHASLCRTQAECDRLTKAMKRRRASVVRETPTSGSWWVVVMIDEEDMVDGKGSIVCVLPRRMEAQRAAIRINEAIEAATNECRHRIAEALWGRPLKRKPVSP